MMMTLLDAFPPPDPPMGWPESIALIVGMLVFGWVMAQVTKHR